MIAKIIMIAAFVAYGTATMLTGRQAESISASFYNWTGWKRIFFIAMTWAISLPLFWLLRTDPWTPWNYLFMASAMCMVLTGTFAAFRESRTEEWFHVVGSFGAILLGLSALWVVYGNWISLLLFIIWYVFIQTHPDIRNKTWWVEVVAFAVIWGGLVVSA